MITCNSIIFNTYVFVKKKHIYLIKIYKSSTIKLKQTLQLNLNTKLKHKYQITGKK